jgi:hypothetical protein
MSTRERLTWGGDKTAAPLPVETADAKRASAHPAIPDEGITHPAGYDDPVQPNAYENGDTSSWAEDVHPGPYENSAHPATPDEGPFHPAAKQAARELRAAVERKAAKCIRIATAMMGKDVTLRDMEKQALTMMELDDNYINSTFARLAKKGEDEEVEEEAKEASARRAGDDEEDEDEGKEASSRLASEDRLLRRLLAEEDMAEDEDGGSDKEATDRFAGIESALATMSKELQAMRGGSYAMDAEPEVAMDEDEALLANLLAEEEAPAEDEDEMLLSMMLEDEMGSEDDEAEALLADMMEEEMDIEVPMPVMAAEESDEEAEDEGASDKEATLADYIGDAEMNISLTAGDDPMGLAGAVDGGDVLSNLYKSASDDEEESDDSDDSDDEDEEAEDDDEGDKEGKKKASARSPRPKKASQGARTIGQPSFDKTASGEINDLERLWKSAPDVSEVF